MKKILLIILPAFLFCHERGFSQDIPAGVPPAVLQQYRDKLAQLGLSQEEFLKILQARGVDVNNITPQNAQQVKSQVDGIIADLTVQRADSLKTVVPTSRPGAANSVNGIRDTTPPEDRTTGQIVRTQASAVGSSNGRNTAEKTRTAAVEQKDVDSTAEPAKPPGPPAKVYGQDKFRDGSILQFVDKDYKAPDTYILGVGDKITVSIFGRSLDNETADILRDGTVHFNKMPPVNVRGLSLSDARKLLGRVFHQAYVFDADEFRAEVSNTRSVSVDIVGEAVNPGRYTISAANSAFNALVFARGVTDVGSVRSIQLKRANGETKILDVYEYLSNPSAGKDFSLRDNDFIVVPVIGKTVYIKGAVLRPARYELTRGENLIKLIQYAAGLAANAYAANIQIIRSAEGKKILDVNLGDLRSQGKDFELANGDSVDVRINLKPLEDVVSVNGAVDFPGDYELVKNMRLSDLIKKAGLRKEARTDYVFIQRFNTDQTTQSRSVDLKEVLANPGSPNNILLQSRDSISIFSQARFSDRYNVLINGAVRHGTRQTWDPGKSLRVSDLVTLAGGLRPDAVNFAYIIRKDTQNGKLIQYIRIENIKQVVQNPASPENILLAPGDEIRTFSNSTFTDSFNIRVSGTVRQPGSFRYDKTLTLKDALTLAGGLKLEAAKNRVQIYRVLFGDNLGSTTAVANIEVDKDLNSISGGNASFELQPFDQIEVRAIPDFGPQKNVLITGEVKYPGQYGLIAKNEKTLSLVRQAGGLTAEAFPPGATLYRNADGVGYIIMKLHQVLADSNSNFNYVLREGDVIDIPKSKDIVTIVGATRANELYPERILLGGKINIAFTEGKNANYYVREYAAGVNKDGRWNRISVLYPNGQIKKTKDFLLFKIYPRVEKGSIVTVGLADKKPEREKNKTERPPIDWSKVLADSIAQATAILSLILLVQRIN